VAASADDETTVVVTITDEGPGIAPSLLPRVFDGFSDPDATHHAEGHGLSLAIARRIVLAHEGSINVESRPEGGASFVIRLPAIFCRSARPMEEVAARDVTANR